MSEDRDMEQMPLPEEEIVGDRYEDRLPPDTPTAAEDADLAAAREEAFSNPPALTGVETLNLPVGGPCDGLGIDFRWQWREHPARMIEALHIAKSEDRLRGDRTFTNYLWQAYGVLAEGQGHNARVLRMYRRCFDYDRLGFFYAAVSASRTSWTEQSMVQNLDWQWRTHRETIREAQFWIRRGGARSPLGVMAFLLSGQIHSKGVMGGYRACFRDNWEWLQQRIKSYR